MQTDKNLRVLVVDDTIVYRKIVSDILSELPNVEVVGVAGNGKIAMSKIERLKPDLLTLDIEMPEMNGLEVLSQIKTRGLDVGVIMLSTLTRTGGEMTLKALELGAFDFITKPQTGTMQENREEIKKKLVPMLSVFVNRKVVKDRLKGKGSDLTCREPEKTRLSAVHVMRANSHSTLKRNNSEVVAIGVSTGGPNALAVMMPELPGDLGVPVLIVQHMPPKFTKSLADKLNSKCALEVREAVDGEGLQPNVALIAPGGKQMKVVAGVGRRDRIVRITDDPPENSCKPSVDYLFRSIAHTYVGCATGVIMTGMGSDGTLGVKLMKRNGSTIIAQDEASCVVYGMPKGPTEAGVVDVVAPLNKIAHEITKTVKRIKG